MTNNFQKKTTNRNSFTLIELLVVLALVAILSVVVILTLNPAELIKQARDSNRLSDLSTINTALNLFSADVTNGFMGTSTIVYVSIPSAISNCSNLGLPTLPAGYTYNCVTATSTRNIDGTGWIPVNFQRISSNSPISQLPVDPINTTSTRLYYAYVAGGSWELSSSVEASKNKLGGSNDLVSKDGGSATSLYEIGNNLNLNPVETGDTSLVGYWNFEEGPSATSSDKSGYGNNGIWYGTSTQNQHYIAGKVGSYAGYFNGGSDWIAVAQGAGRNLNLSNYADGITISGWVKDAYTSSQIRSFFGMGNPYNANGYGIILTYYYPTSAERIGIQIRTGGTPVGSADFGVASAIFSGIWTHFTLELTNSAVTLYLNGSYVNSINISSVGISPLGSSQFRIGEYGEAIMGYWNGSMDDLRIYSRALSAAEVLALYNATK